MPYTLEVCVDSTASALAAMQGGVHRLELCADLVIGGTTPSLALLQQVKAETGLPVRALLRPRFGDFCYDRWELAQMAQSAARLVEAGADGIVTGVLTPEGDVDVEALQPIYAAARAAAQRAGRPVACTLHRAQHKVPGREHCSSKPQRLEVVRKVGGFGLAGGHDAQHPPKVLLQGGIQQRPACGRQTEQRRRPCRAKACGDLLIFRCGFE